MEDEAREILRATLSVDPARSGSLVASIRARVEAVGGVELELPSRDAMRSPLDFDP
jgi:plasmid stability protein